MTTSRHVWRLLVWTAAVYLTACAAAGVFLAETTLHLHKRRLNGAGYCARVGSQFHARVHDISISAADGAVLKGWFVEPPTTNGEAVVLLHGITDNRLGISGFGDYFLAHGYSVLLPDSRAHGESGGAIATYGILERDDVRRWVDWVRQRAPGCTYLLGESMGAAIGLEATAVTPRLCAAAVESPYATFRDISYDRLAWRTHLAPLFWRTLGRPAIEAAILYAGARYDVNLPQADPEQAVRHSQVPILLIAGTADHNIPAHHAQELERACPGHCSLWIVPGADHGGASRIAPLEFWQRVPKWFESHGTPAGP